MALDKASNRCSQLIFAGEMAPRKACQASRLNQIKKTIELKDSSRVSPDTATTWRFMPAHRATSLLRVELRLRGR